MHKPTPNKARLQIIPLPAFKDNYIWLIASDEHAVVVDPGDADVVFRALEAHALKLDAVLITHHHNDHIGGLEALVETHPAPVFAPADPRIPGKVRAVRDGERITLLGGALLLDVMEVPGHTETHIAYHGDGLLFPGDTLFSAGCGRLLGGTAAQLHASLARLAALPGETQVYPTHEYTLSNLAFAAHVEPHNAERDDVLSRARASRSAGEPTLPTTLAVERAINPFLRTTHAGIRASVQGHLGHEPGDDLATFTALRAWKDVFQAP